MGSHTVTHCPLAPRTAKRQAFELRESARVISNHFSSSPLFAYPYGSADVASDSTKTALIDSNYICGFLTHPGFAQNVSDVYCIPRIVIPKLGIGLAEFQARVTGGQIPFNTVSRLLGLR